MPTASAAPTIGPTASPEPPRPTPTLDPLRNIPERGVITSTYTVQRGDTLSGIAEVTGATVEELMQINGMLNADRLKVGQDLLVLLPIEGHAPSVKLIPDSELVNSPTAITFDVVKYVTATLGYIKVYTEEVDGAPMDGAHIVMRIAEQYSIHPRILLALLEYKGGWLSNPNPTGDQRDYPLGYNKTDIKSLYLQLSWASARLNEGYYGWRLASRLWVRLLDDGGRAYMGNGINAGTAGAQNYLAAISTRATWQDVMGANGFITTWRKLFGDPWKYDLGMLVPADLQQPTLDLPWAKGQTWLFTGGPHATWGAGTPWGALDFTAWGAYGCNELSDWVTAMSDGAVARSRNGEVVVSLDASADERAGWAILYLHMGTEGRAQLGARIKAGDRIGHPSCEGGVTNGSHAHLARKYNGEWLNATGAIPFTIGGWMPAEGGQEYDGKITNGKLTRTPCECKELATNGITH